MNLSQREKEEFVQDGKDQQRRKDFRKLRSSLPKMSFEEYLSWMEEVQQIGTTNLERKFIFYKDVRI